MTQEDKELLLKDLCARLPYGVICLIHDVNSDDYSRSITGNDIDLFSHHLITLKPYLRPMSSMTEEEEKKIRKINKQFINELHCSGVFAADDGGCTVIEMAEILNFLNAHHFDYRGLIDKGLALEAPEGMYTDDKFVSITKEELEKTRISSKDYLI